MARVGRHADAIADAIELTSDMTATADTLYRAVRIFALSSAGPGNTEGSRHGPPGRRAAPSSHRQVLRRFPPLARRRGPRRAPPPGRLR